MRSDSIWVIFFIFALVLLFVMVYATVNGKLPQQAGKCLESHQIVHQDKIVDICDKWVME